MSKNSWDAQISLEGVFVCWGGVDNRVGCIKKKSGSGKSGRKEVNMIKRLCMKLSNNKRMVGEQNNQKTL